MKRRENWNDTRLDSPGVSNWRVGSKMQVKGTNLLVLEPTSITNKLCEFELASTEVIGFGLLSGFLIEGVFEVKTPTVDWAPCGEDDGAQIILQPNWFEHLVHKIDVFHINSEINPHDVPIQADPFLNGFIYSFMDQFTKAFLCPEPCNPGRATAVTKEDWKATPNSEYTKYAKAVFGRRLKFRHIPLFKFPFYQQPNFVMDGKRPTAIPIPQIGNLHIRVYFKDDQKIFKKSPTATANSYRFRMSSIHLVAEEMRLNPAAERAFLTSKKSINYEGVTKLGMAHNIPAGIFTYTAKLNKVLLPEGIFIFCLLKTVIPGTYDFNTFTDNIFLPHNIKSVQVYFGGKPFYSKMPTVNDIGHHLSDCKHYFDHLTSPPFGVHQRPSYLDFARMANGSDTSPYPHVYIDLTQGKPDTRLVPVNDQGTIIQTKEFLDVALQFNTTGVTADATYFIYYRYKYHFRHAPKKIC